MLTLIAIPYVKHKYGAEFSLLSLNSMVLILHLSFTDLLYILVKFPQLIQVRKQLNAASSLFHADLSFWPRTSGWKFVLLSWVDYKYWWVTSFLFFIFTVR